MDRREFLWAGSVALASCATRPTTADPRSLDALLAAHADVLPAKQGAGANHDPMAAEALTALGAEAAIPVAWRRRADSYRGELPRRAPIEDPVAALGDQARHGDWLDHFRRALAARPWHDVLATAVPFLAPGLVGAAWHGVIRTAHAVRALQHHDNPVRRTELANGLAYWASAYAELSPPTGTDPVEPRSVLAAAQRLAPTRPTVDDVAFDAVTARLTDAPVPAVVVDTSPQAALRCVITSMVLVLQEMLAQQQQRIWVLHAVTGPAAVGLLLPEVPEPVARQLVGHAGRGALATCAAFAAPFAARAHVTPRSPDWSQLVAAATAGGSVHTIKLVEVLRRFDDGDPSWRSVAASWLAWR